MSDTAQPAPVSTWRRLRGPLFMVGKWAIVVVCVVFMVRLVRRVDWGRVFDAVTHLLWWQILVLFLLMLLRQVAMAGPLVFLVPGLGLPHATMCSMAGTLVQTVTPPPSDKLLRASMLASWGVDPARGTAALVLNLVALYLTRFAAPTVGLIVVLVFAGTFEHGYVWTALLGLALAGALAGVLALIARSRSTAEKVGLKAGQMAKKVQRKVEPRKWADWVVRLQEGSSERLVQRVGAAWVAFLVFVLIDGLIVVVCLRFLGIPASQLPPVLVLGAFLSVFPLTFAPFAGLGVLEAALILLLLSIAEVDQSALVAALVVWRVTTLILPLLPGGFALFLWRRNQKGEPVG